MRGVAHRHRSVTVQAVLITEGVRLEMSASTRLRQRPIGCLWMRRPSTARFPTCAHVERARRLPQVRRALFSDQDCSSDSVRKLAVAERCTCGLPVLNEQALQSVALWGRARSPLVCVKRSPSCAVWALEKGTRLLGIPLARIALQTRPLPKGLLSCKSLGPGAYSAPLSEAT